MLEAERYYNAYIPNLEEYLENAWISISAPIMLMRAYFIVTNPIKKRKSWMAWKRAPK